MRRSLLVGLTLAVALIASAWWLAAADEGELPADPMTSTACIPPPDYDTFAPPAEALSLIHI